MVKSSAPAVNGSPSKLPTKAKPVTKANRAGLHMPVSRINTMLKKRTCELTYERG